MGEGKAKDFQISKVFHLVFSTKKWEISYNIIIVINQKTFNMYV